MRRESKQSLSPSRKATHRKKISGLVKCSPPNSGDRGVIRQAMNANDADLTPESQRELAAGVLKQAAQDLRRFHGAMSKIERELYLDAYRWLTVDECSWPFSFQNVCRLLRLSPENVRQELIGDASLNAFTYPVRRCKRAASRLRSSLRQLFVSEGNESASMPADYAEARKILFHKTTFVGGSSLYENVN